MQNRKTTLTRHSPQDVVAIARQWIGTPYHHQASAKGIGTDCLGLVRGVYQALYGFEAEVPPAYSRDWAEAGRQETMVSGARRHLIEKQIADVTIGDVILFRIKSHCVAKHTAILTTPTSMVHAMEGVPVCEVHLTRWWRRRIAAIFSFPGTEI